MKIRIKSEKGITLISLIITIIILLILAGVTIGTLSRTGIFSKAANSKDRYVNAQQKENGLLNETMEIIEDEFRMANRGATTTITGNGTGGITPAGTIDITENGEYDVTNYASANVNVNDNIENGISLVDKMQYTGNTSNTYTFHDKIDFGMVIITSSNNSNDSSYFISNINSLSSGSYEVFDDSTAISGSNIGHRSKIYFIRDVDVGTTIQFGTRYASLVQILKIR